MEHDVKDQVVDNELALSECLVRRGAAMDIAGLLQFESHQMLSAHFLRKLKEVPADPHHYQK
eukprot:6395921-Amphidinium_carterae.1